MDDAMPQQRPVECANSNEDLPRLQEAALAQIRVEPKPPVRWPYWLITALLVIAALALLCSVVFDSPAQAVVMTIAAYLTLYIVGRVEFFEHLRPYFFTTDMDFWRDVFKPEIPWRSLWHYACVCGAYTIGLLLATVVIFERKDIVT